MYAETAVWSFAPGSYAAVRETAAKVLIPALCRQEGVRRCYLIHCGTDTYLTLTLFETEADARRSRTALDPLFRLHHGRLLEGLERFAGEVELVAVGADVGRDGTARAGAFPAEGAKGATTMAIGVLFEIECGAAEYDEVMRRLAGAGVAEPAGRLYHVAGPVEGGWRVVDVWESPEQLQAFGGTLMPIMAAVGIPPVTPQVFPAHNIVAGRSTAAV